MIILLYVVIISIYFCVPVSGQEMMPLQQEQHSNTSSSLSLPPKREKQEESPVSTASSPHEILSRSASSPSSVSSRVGDDKVERRFGFPRTTQPLGTSFLSSSSSPLSLFPRNQPFLLPVPDFVHDAHLLPPSSHSYFSAPVFYISPTNLSAEFPLLPTPFPSFRSSISNNNIIIITLFIKKQLVPRR